MNNTAKIHKYSYLFLALVPLFAIWGFWPTYFAGVVRPVSVHDHLHGIAMFGWCFLLIAQALLIRRGNRGGHRTLGKVSYLLVPFIAISTIILANHRLNDRGLSMEGLFILMLQLTILAQFLTIYALAIKNRKQRDVHARYMVCTALPMIDPIFARILFNFLPPELWPTAQFYTFGLTDLILIALIAWDWRSSGRRDVFLPALLLLIALQLPVFLLVNTPAWHAFAGWFMALPIS